MDLPFLVSRSVIGYDEFDEESCIDTSNLHDNNIDRSLFIPQTTSHKIHTVQSCVTMHTPIASVLFFYVTTEVGTF